MGAGVLGAEQRDLAAPRALAPPGVGCQVVQRPPQVSLGAGGDAPRVAQQPLQRGLQQVLGVGAVAGEGERDGHQPVAALGNKPLQLSADRVTFLVTPHHAAPFGCRHALRLHCRWPKTKWQGQRLPHGPGNLTRSWLVCARWQPVPGSRREGGRRMGAAVEELVREGMQRLAASAEVPPGLTGRACAAVPQRALGSVSTVSASRNPARASLIAETNASIAPSWPNTMVFKSRSRLRSTSRSSRDTLFGGIRAIVDKIERDNVWRDRE